MTNFWHRFLLLASAFFLISLVFLTNSPPIWPDEVIVADYAYNLSAQGRLISSLHGSMYHADQGLFFYPPLLPILLALVFKFSGLSVVGLRLLAIFSGLILFLTVLKQSRPLSTWWLAGLWLLDFSLMRASRFGRPEIFVLSLTFVSLWLLFSRYRYRYLLASIIAVLCFLIHPLGILAILLIAVNLISQRRFKNLFILSGLFIAGVMIWFLTINFQIQTLFEVLQWQAQRRLSEPSFFVFLSQNSLFYYAAIHWLYFGLSVFLCGYFWLNQHPDSKTGLLIIGLIVGWLFIFYGREPWYYVYPVPFLYLLWVKFWESLKNKSGKIFFWLISGVMLFVNLNLFSLDWQSSQGSYQKFTQTIVSQLPKNSTVFLSSIPDPYYGLKTSHKNLRLYQFAPLPEEKSKYYQILDDSEYLVFTGYLDYGFNNVLKQYLKKNTKRIIEIDNGPGEYQAQLIKLVPKTRRRH
ncbi:hypothetical protein A2313_00610 [Candidatus Roizmanbacteria bacterium RIFOXYB2_FULL_41_10]|nr:MAG: hypothetical protein A2377_03215 [Candidatus Roizmanbacteria bacterium RIFOXYB1_FULL_41_27]OGK70745.1 MAG: hypothetical protein A2403_01490 [Candidatus Roizmanbacteria bacterium RIFOXYC1_FULL_41_16]OGK71462.1 MAG: hypothetical protein A2313_00610 [Candidatus Roizmanbacteria bacterium RIFOXYB2_FULL_41_10]OGK75675.1 MAG: hypothetical protein A2575_03205 [Candidatus Roizmanbacteria bacterium RIFOXYD1_FULL_41_24]OGK76335.1 MAG: hypothetical protein A2459_03685 [Candidatus Roizmanbacteria ba